MAREAVASEPMDGARVLNAYLRFVDRSRSYSAGVTHDSLAPLHEGPVAAGQEIPFSFRIPADAYPNWDVPTTADYGTLRWSIVIEADIAAGLDTITTHPVPIDPAREWTGPTAANEPRFRKLVDDWGVEVEPDRWSLRRGEQVTMTLRIGKPKQERPKLEVLFACQVNYKVEVREPTSSTGEFKRVIKKKVLFVEHPEFDPALPEQSFTFTLPTDLPFSYDGGVVSFLWFAVAKERRRFFQSDAGREAYLEVAP